MDAVLIQALLSTVQIIVLAVIAYSNNCSNCHSRVTPNVVTDWRLSKHSQSVIPCDACHGSAHKSASDVNLALAPTVIEQKLFEMHLEDRIRTFQGAFHANPDYALWYGWSAVIRDLAEIKEMTEDLRNNHAK